MFHRKNQIHPVGWHIQSLVLFALLSYSKETVSFPYVAGKDCKEKCKLLQAVLRRKEQCERIISRVKHQRVVIDCTNTLSVLEKNNTSKLSFMKIESSPVIYQEMKHEDLLLFQNHCTSWNVSKTKKNQFDNLKTSPWALGHWFGHFSISDILKKNKICGKKNSEMNQSWK